MALRHRNPIMGTEDRENLAVKAGKNAIKKQQILPTTRRRPALEDLGNKIHIKPTSQQENLKITKKVENVIKEKTVIDVVTKPIAKVVPLIKTNSVSEISHQSTIIEDPDYDTKDDPQMVTEYIVDIFRYLKELEFKYKIKENYLDNGHKTTPKMREILMNWLVDVQVSFKLCLDTLHLGVSIVDRYLQECPSVGRETLQLVGVSALLLAAKYEELCTPDVEDYVFICDNTFSTKQILQMEMMILSKLNCCLGNPLSIHFLRRYSKIAKAEPAQHQLGKYILELALVSYETCYFSPSMQAAAACCLAIAILNNEKCVSKIWNPTLVRYTNYKYTDFKEVLYKFANLLLVSKTWKNQAVQNKYSSTKFEKISLNSKLKGSLVKMLADKCK